MRLRLLISTALALGTACAGTVAPPGRPVATVGAPKPAPSPSASSTSSGSSGVGPTASATPAPSATFAWPTPTPADRAFTLEKPVSFAPGLGTPKQRAIAKHTRFGGASGDLRTFVIGVDQHGALITPGAPAGVSFPAHSIQDDGARFSPDGARVAVLQYLGPLQVLSATDGARVWARADGAECDARFVDDGHVVFHAMSKESAARLWTVDLATGIAAASGVPVAVDACTGAPDAGRWLLYVDFEDGAPAGVIRVRDAASGAVLELVRGLASTWALSPTADRACWVDPKAREVVCRRATDGGRERILGGIDAQGLEIDPLGARMLIGAAKPGSDGEPEAVMYLVDFAAATVRRLNGVGLHTGGTLHLLAGGHLVAAGGADGVEVFDVDAGKRTVAKRTPFYSVHPLPGEARRFVAGSEPGSGGSLEDVYLVEVP